MKTNNKIRIGGHKFAYPNNIMKLEACENYTNITFRNGAKTMVATTLGILQKRLEDYGFCRPNRGSVVNIDFVKSIEQKGNTYKLKLNNREKLLVSKRRVSTMLSLKFA